MNNKNNTKKKVIITILALVLVAIGVLFALKGCQKQEPVVHTHSYKINEEGTWICNDDNDILSNTDKPYVAILENNQPKDILAIDSLSKTKINLGNGTIYKDGNNIYYSGNNAQTVIIKTQKVDDKQKDKDNLVINAPNDTVYHYGSSTVISLDAVATNSFHEYGKVDLITLTKARVVLENKSDVKEIYLDINNTNYSYETTIIALKENVELPRLTRDAVDLEEGEVKTLAIVQKLKDEVKTETNTQTNEVIETVLEVQAADDDYVKIENVRKSNDELIIEAFLSPNADENDKTLTDNQSTSTVTLEEAKVGSSHPASHNTFVPKQEKVTEVIKPTETKEETKQEETKPVVTPTKKEETKPEVTPTEDDKPSTPTHTHSYSYTAISDSQHKGACSCGASVTGNHTYGDDNICDVCGYEKNAVARIGKTYYQTLSAAISAAVNDNTIVILKDITVDNSNVIDKNIALELNGKKITTVEGDAWKGESPTKQGIFYVKSGATFTINGTGEISTKNSNVYGAIVLTIGGDASNNDSSKTAELVVNGGTLKGYYYGVVTHGERHNTKITVNGGYLTGVDSADATSIYHPNKGTLTITGGTLEGYDGLAIKGGNVNITGGTFIANGNWNEAEAAQSSGSNSVGAALYVEGNYGYDAKIDVSGGEFVANGTDGKAVYVGFSEDPKANINITGGVYNSNPSEYVATFGYKINNKNPDNGQWGTIEAIDGKWTVTANPESNAEVSVSKQGETTLYGTLGQFRNDVNNDNNYQGYTVTVLKDLDYTNEEWVPIGIRNFKPKINKAFRGIFNGNNKTIKVKNSNITCCDYFGFFGEIRNGDDETPRRIYDLVLDVDFTCSDTEMPYNVVGGLASQIYGFVDIENVTVRGSIKSNRIAGGLIGNANVGFTSGGNYVDTFNITNCHVEADVGAFSVYNSENWLAIGGIIGQNDSDVGLTIDNCTFTGELETFFDEGYQTEASSYMGYALAKGARDGGSEITTISNFTVGEGSSIVGYQNVTTHSYPFEGLNKYDSSNTYTGTPNHNKELLGGYFFKCTIDGETTGGSGQQHYPHGSGN